MPDTPIKTVLGFDFGLKRIGVAVGQTVTATARPLLVLKAQDGAPKWNEVEQLLQQWQPQALIVGYPSSMDGTAHDISRAAQRFGNRLHGRYHLAVHMVDERLSSFEAETMQKNGEVEEGSTDSLAAALILESWLREYKSNNDT